MKTTLPLETVVARRAAGRQESIAVGLGKSASAVSRFLSGENRWSLNDIEALLAELGLAITSADEVAIDADEYERLLDIAAKYYADKKNSVRGGRA